MDDSQVSTALFHELQECLVHHDRPVEDIRLGSPVCAAILSRAAMARGVKFAVTRVNELLVPPSCRCGESATTCCPSLRSPVY